MDHRIPPLSRRAALVAATQALAVLAAACTSLPPANAPAAPGAPATPSPTPFAPPTQNPSCAAGLAPVVRPTPIPYPGYVQVEPSTGLHVTAPPQVIEVADYRLVVKGKVEREVTLTYDEIRCLPKIGQQVVIECPGFFVDTSNLAGASLAAVLALAGPLPGAERVEFRGIDGRTNSVLMDSALAGGASESEPGSRYFLAYEWEGEPLPVSHGFPLRAALPGETGGSWVKWLQEITLI